MEEGFQKVNYQSRLMEWSRHLEVSRTSGQRVREMVNGTMCSSIHMAAEEVSGANADKK